MGSKLGCSWIAGQNRADGAGIDRNSENSVRKGRIDGG